MKRPSTKDNDLLPARAVRRALLRWFDENARDLPWRRTNDPYAIWISEIMLQQTQVATVGPYYECFMRRFPTVEKLARARLDAVLKQWEGLGYYSRARNMHRAAGEILERFGGRLPETKDELLTLPGIGAYTAGAVASIAFGRREPVVDGNVTRVLCRLCRIQDDPKKSAVQKEIWSLAERLLPAARPGDFNQALMELGSEICLPRSPRCDACPLNRMCQARLHGDQAELPIRSARKKIPRYTVVVGVIRKQGRILIDKRKPEGLLGGLWEFPGGKKKRGETLEAALRREIREEIGIRIRIERRLTTVDHAYSHFRIRLHAFECVYVSGAPRCGSCTDIKWVRPTDLNRYAFPAANAEIIRALRAQ
ncbi:MAG: A/G-specific adenine glycosylase [Phycisphaerales bacterium]|nr:MAG: A/G-specific adenine glycosylase [Phycisphaerales bacterium]